jgi:class 3 adenylate cyclase
VKCTACGYENPTGAVIGRDFAVDVLQAVAGVSEDELLTALEEAMHVSVLEEVAHAREVRYRFTHAFFRQTLYEEMIAPRRLRLHRQVAQALETHYAGRVDEHAAELADHFSHSSNEADLAKSVRYGELAAHPEEPIRVRIGLHTGEAIREADKFFGKTVILAARIAAQAQGGEILVSSLVKELTHSSGDIQFGSSYEAELKEVSGLHARCTP